MATNNTSSSNPLAENMGDVLDALSSSIAKTAAREPIGHHEVVVHVEDFEYRQRSKSISRISKVITSTN